MAIDYWGEMPESTGDYEQKGGGTLIPEGTIVLASVEEIKTQTFKDSSHESLNLKWRIEEPDDYNNKVFNQKIKNNGEDPLSQYYDAAKQESRIKNAQNMFAAIDANAGGNVKKLMRKPTDAELTQYIVAAKMWVHMGVVGTTQIVRGVKAYKPIDDPSKQATNATAPKTPANQVGADDIDDIPFN